MKTNLKLVKKVVSIRSNSINTNQDIIEELQMLLHKARLGEIQTFIASSLTEDSTIIHSRSGEWLNKTNTIVGILEDSKYEMLKIQNGD